MGWEPTRFRTSFWNAIKIIVRSRLRAKEDTRCGWFRDLLLLLNKYDSTGQIKRGMEEGRKKRSHCIWNEEVNVERKRVARESFAYELHKNRIRGFVDKQNISTGYLHEIWRGRIIIKLRAHLSPFQFQLFHPARFPFNPPRTDIRSCTTFCLFLFCRAFKFLSVDFNIQCTAESFDLCSLHP